jgi:hypothetical protein
MTFFLEFFFVMARLVRAIHVTPRPERVIALAPDRFDNDRSHENRVFVSRQREGDRRDETGTGRATLPFI